MSEITEFLVFLSALRSTPGTLRGLVGKRPEPREEEILRTMIAEDRRATARLEVLVSGGRELPGDVPGDPPSGDPLAVFEAGRRRLLALLDTVDAATLHATGRLPSGRELDPWRLAGNLADHDVHCIARLRHPATT